MCFYCAFYGPLTLRVIVRDAGVGPFSAENTTECLAAPHRYFGPRARETGTEAERGKRRKRERERSKGSAVISLVKAGLFCEFLISVHLPVIRLHETSRTQIYTVTCIHIHMAYIHVRTHLMTRIEEDRGRRRIERAKEREGRKEAYFHPRASPPCRRLMYKGNVRRKMGYEEAARVL